MIRTGKLMRFWGWELLKVIFLRLLHDWFHHEPPEPLEVFSLASNHPPEPLLNVSRVEGFR